MYIKNYFGGDQRVNFNEEVHLTAVSIVRRMNKVEDLLANCCGIELNSKLGILKGEITCLHGLEQVIKDEVDYDKKIEICVHFLRNRIKARNIDIILEELVDNYDVLDEADMINLEYKINKLIGLDKYEVSSRLNFKKEIEITFKTEDALDPDDMKMFLHLNSKFNILIKFRTNLSIIEPKTYRTYDLGIERTNFEVALRHIIEEATNEKNNINTNI